MKNMLILLSIVALCIAARAEDKNVLRYYAVDNSLDGQPAVDMVNVLRFYPVFAMQDSIHSVQVTIYYGANRFTRDAEEMNEGKYWQVLLPKFKLGEAIQRLEVEVHLHLNYALVEEYNRLKRTELAALRDRGNKIQEGSGIAAKETELIEIFESIGLEKSHLQQLYAAYQKSIVGYERMRDKIIEKNYPESDQELVSNIVDSLVIDRALIRFDNKTSFAVDSLRENLRKALLEEVSSGLADTLLTGPSIKKSDIIVIEKDVDEIHARDIAAKILYRNYKKSLRRLQALDPVERMGIFRVRYVPFPVVGVENSAKLRLLAPLQNGSPTVFEIGLSFGDAIVPGDEFVVPSFSFDRLGVAFAITEDLFENEATVRALVLTYDFNSYGSLGVGANFPGDKVRGYVSFGINKRAFENALAGLAKLFQ